MIILRPQDVVIVLGIVACGGGPFASFAYLSAQTGVSPGEVHKSLRRASAAGLYHEETRRVSREDVLQFLYHGVRYVFPAVRGPLARGVPTGVAAPPLMALFDGDALPPDLTPVWPSPTGRRRGYTIDPLYRTAPAIAERNPALYELLALTDAIREGRARERSEANRALTSRLVGFPER